MLEINPSLSLTVLYFSPLLFFDRGLSKVKDSHAARITKKLIPLILNKITSKFYSKTASKNI